MQAEDRGAKPQYDQEQRVNVKTFMVARGEFSPECAESLDLRNSGRNNLGVSETTGEGRASAELI